MTDHPEKNSNLWYIKKAGKVTGPFPVKLIGSYLVLGRIDLDTVVSTDQDKWIPVGRLPSLIPDELKAANTVDGKASLRQAKLREDERRGELRREAPNKEGKERAEHERREAVDRRKNSEKVSKSYLHLKADLAAKKIKAKKRTILGIVFITIAVTVMIVSFFFVEPNEVLQKTDCSIKAGPNIDWSGCRKDNINLRSKNLQKSNLHSIRMQSAILIRTKLIDVNLSYSNLEKSNLSYANLTNSLLVGANLNKANLSNVVLVGANLSYADLTGANISSVQVLNTRFDNAIWVDGSQCARQSIDRCIPLKSK